MTTVQKKHNTLSAHQVLNDSRFLVIKVGSVLIRGKEMDEVNTAWMESLAQDIADLMKRGIKVVVVSSGGIALGRKALGIPADIAPGAIRLEQKQAASAVGQYHMFNGYFKAFSKVGITAAQVLLTMSETENRRLNLNARETLYTLLDKGIVPVINENDTVSTGEIRFGDNDRLSVRVAQMIQADTVLLLSTTHGLYTANPDLDPSAQHIPVIEQLEEKHLQMAGSAIAGLSTGGMKSKIEAAQSATRSGISMVIANGRDNHILKTLIEDPTRPCSIFVAQKSEAGAKMIWLQSHMRPKGIVTIDDGALKALKSGKSLLPVGVKKIEGHFQRGDAIEIRTLEGKKVGMGISAYDIADATLIIGRNTADIEKILGYAGRDELVHRNDMVLELK